MGCVKLLTLVLNQILLLKVFISLLNSFIKWIESKVAPPVHFKRHSCLQLILLITGTCAHVQLVNDNSWAEKKDFGDEENNLLKCE